VFTNNVHTCYVVLFILDDSPASEFYVPTMQHSVCFIHTTYEDGTDRAFRIVGTYNSDAGESIQHTQHDESLKSRIIM
jgi:hypothetical protein